MQSENDEIPAPKSRGRIRRTLITGLIILTPLLVTAWVVDLVLAQITGLVSPVVKRLFAALGTDKGFETAVVDYLIPVVSLVLALGFIYLLGLLGSNVLGRQLLKSFEQLMMQIPLVRGIYSATRQFLETFSRDKNSAFRKVVLFQYPREGLWTMGLLTGTTEGEVREQVGFPVVSVFVPTTPNPTSGWLIFVPIEDVIELEMSVDDAFKMIISGGVLAPPRESDDSQSVESASEKS